MTWEEDYKSYLEIGKYTGWFTDENEYGTMEPTDECPEQVAADCSTFVLDSWTDLSRFQYSLEWLFELIDLIEFRKDAFFIISPYKVTVFNNEYRKDFDVDTTRIAAIYQAVNYFIERKINDV